MNSLFNPLQDVSRWMAQIALAAALFSALSISHVGAVELKPISTSGASHSSASSSLGWEDVTDEPEQQHMHEHHDDMHRDDMHHDSRDEERMAQEIAKSVVNQVMENMHRGDGPDFLNGSTVSLALLIPILAITFVIGGPIFIVLYLIRARYQTKQKRLEIINSNIDKLIASGRDIPPELLRNESSVGTNYNEMLHSGIKNVFVGIALFLFLMFFFNFAFGTIGFIVMAVGLSQLAIWALSAPKPERLKSEDNHSSNNLF